MSVDTAIDTVTVNVPSSKRRHLDIEYWQELIPAQHHHNADYSIVM